MRNMHLAAEKVRPNPSLHPPCCSGRPLPLAGELQRYAKVRIPATGERFRIFHTLRDTTGTFIWVTLYVTWVGISMGGILFANWLISTVPSIPTWIVAGLIWLVCFPGALAGIIAGLPVVLLALAGYTSAIWAIIGLLIGMPLSVAIAGGLLEDMFFSGKGRGSSGHGRDRGDQGKDAGRGASSGSNHGTRHEKSPLFTASSIFPDFFGFGSSLRRGGKTIGRLEQATFGDDTIVLWGDHTPAGRITTGPFGRKVVTDASGVRIGEITRNFADETVIVDKEGRQRRIIKDHGGNTVIE